MPNQKVDLNKVRAGIKVPNHLQVPLQKIELAGKKVMYSKDTHQLVMQAMSGDKPWEEKIATGIADLMAILYKQSNNSMPPQLIVPAAILLMCDAIEFMQQSGQAPQLDIGTTMEGTIVMTLTKFGVKPDQIKGALEKYAKGGMINAATNGRPTGAQQQAQPQPGAAPGV